MEYLPMNRSYASADTAKLTTETYASPTGSWAGSSSAGEQSSVLVDPGGEASGIVERGIKRGDGVPRCGLGTSGMPPSAE
jgi:hypothetical protein